MSELKTNKFKVGDQVRRIKEGWSEMPIGSIRRVLSIVNDQEITFAGSTTRWMSEYFELVENEEVDISTYEVPEKRNVKGIPSDGGSSDYYFTTLPRHLIDQIVETGGIEIKDIIRYVFDNNADAFNIVKAQKRIVEANKGKGKLGITALYDANKIKFFAKEQYEAIKQGEVE